LTARVWEAAADDLNTVAALDRAFSPVFSAPDGYARLLGKSGLLLLVAVESLADNPACGFAAFSQVLDESTLLNILVIPEARSRGAAHALLQEAWRILHRRHVRRILLEVRQGNVPAINLYRSEGFRVDGERRDYYPAADGTGRETAILMSRELED
jgi:ribosomal-protein-alanine N-acetyltransferase